MAPGVVMKPEQNLTFRMAREMIFHDKDNDDESIMFVYLSENFAETKKTSQVKNLYSRWN